MKNLIFALFLFASIRAVGQTISVDSVIAVNNGQKWQPPPPGTASNNAQTWKSSTSNFKVDTMNYQVGGFRVIQLSAKQKNNNMLPVALYLIDANNQMHFYKSVKNN